MATILLTGEDTAALETFAAVIESMGHTTIHAITTENVVEDVVINAVALVISLEASVPFSGFEVADILREDPSVPARLPILLAAEHEISARKIEAHGLSGVLSTGDPAHSIIERVVSLLGEDAAPDPHPAVSDRD